MRHAVHRVRLFDDVAVDARGNWVPDPASAADVTPIKAWVGNPRKGESQDGARQVDCVAVVAPDNDVDVNFVEVLDHPVHDGVYRVAGTSGGRWVKRIGLIRYEVSVGVDVVR